ncbi:MAG: carbon starvation protein A [Thermodesulfovibrionales bacterium]|nr:carbon starvation protein A [Thermodesulfovibrionales bacterium]
MNILFLLIFTILVFIFAYRIYGGYISRVFNASDANPTPAKEIYDGVDYVPSKTPVVFSHHFASIAGGGPIIGPTIALIYGFYPSWLWIILGGILIGAVHDYTSLFVSLREKGRSIAEIARKTMGTTGFILFILFTLFLIILVSASFLSLTAAALTSMVNLETLQLPEEQTLLKTLRDEKTGDVKAVIGGVASTSVIVITLFAPLLGFLIVKRQIKTMSAVTAALLIAILSLVIGLKFPVRLSSDTWMVLLSIYCFFASAIPVWLVLQPRDFINSFILYGGLFALISGIIIGGIKGINISAPAFNSAEGYSKLGPLWPVLFITVACGAISGFHSLVASGTTSKQIQRESDARRIGYGGMLLESLLAVSVLIAVGAALSFSDYSKIVFPDPGKGRSNPVLAFSLGTGFLLDQTVGIPVYIGTIFGIIMVEGFLATTLDTSVRLGRYLLEELWKVIFKEIPALFRSIYFNSGIIVLISLLLAYKQGFLLVWPVFGSANQLLASLALIAVSLWLTKRSKKSLFTLLPAVFMLLTTVASLTYLTVTKYLPSRNLVLTGIAVILIILAVSVSALSWKSLFISTKGSRTVVKDTLVD